LPPENVIQEQPPEKITPKEGRLLSTRYLDRQYWMNMDEHERIINTVDGRNPAPPGFTKPCK